MSTDLVNANIETPKSYPEAEGRLSEAREGAGTARRDGQGRGVYPADTVVCEANLTTEYDEGAVGGQPDTERLPRFSVQTAIWLNRRGVAYRSEEAFRAERAPIRQRAWKASRAPDAGHSDSDVIRPLVRSALTTGQPPSIDFPCKGNSLVFYFTLAGARF